MNKEFKVGDFVYYPDMGTKVFQLEKTDCFVNYPVCIRFSDIDSDFESFTPRGLARTRNKLPQIFHATPENQAKLEAFHGIPFEPAPPKPTPKEIIQAMLDIEKLPIPCWVSNVDEQPSSINRWDFIDKVIDSNSPFINKNGLSWKYATPLDRTTLQPITELPE